MKPRKRFTVLTVCLILLVSLLAGCSGKSGGNTGGNAGGTSGGGSATSTNTPSASSKQIKITFFNTSAEVNTVFEKLFAKYHEVNPNVTVELIPTPIGGAQIEIFQSRLASGNPPTISNLDPSHIYIYRDKFLDLEPVKAKYEELTLPGAVEGGILDGKFLGIPWTAQGYGLLYNTRVVEEAIGGKFDPSTIRTRDALKELLEKVEAAMGVPPVMIHGADWSLGAHYFGALGFSLQSRDMNENLKYWEDVKAGRAKLADNAVFNGLMDTFDLLKEHNYRKNDPLVANYELDSADFAKGKAAFYFMGDWVWAVIGSLEGRDNEFGVLPRADQQQSGRLRQRADRLQRTEAVRHRQFRRDAGRTAGGIGIPGMDADQRRRPEGHRRRNGIDHAVQKCQSRKQQRGRQGRGRICREGTNDQHRHHQLFPDRLLGQERRVHAKIPGWPNQPRAALPGNRAILAIGRITRSFT